MVTGHRKLDPRGGLTVFYKVKGNTPLFIMADIGSTVVEIRRIAVGRHMAFQILVDLRIFRNLPIDHKGSVRGEQSGKLME